MRHKFLLVLLKQFWCNMKTEVDTEQKVDFKAVHFADQNSTNLRIISVVVVCIVEKLSSKEDSGYYHTMNIEISKKEIIPLNQTVNVNQRQYETFI